MRRLVLASGSPSRRSLLESAGLAPEVLVSHVAEDGVENLPTEEAVAVLARRKGEAVAATVADQADGPIILACDSLLELGDESWGKAGTADEVVRRWRLMSGREGRLHTGHFASDLSSGRTAERTDTTTVRFGRPTERQIAAYAATAESRRVAGPFTMEGRSAPWVESIEGNPGTVTGISLPVVTALLAELGVEIIELWR